jgi:hypothetical protein
MGLSEKAREYLDNKRKAFETEQYLPRDAKESDGFLLRDYSFGEYVSEEEKEKANLDILKKW